MSSILDSVWLTIGIINSILIVIATIVIVYNKKMTAIGRVLRIIWIVILPVLGPILTLIEVLLWRLKDERINKKKEL